MVLSMRVPPTDLWGTLRETVQLDASGSVLGRATFFVHANVLQLFNGFTQARRNIRGGVIRGRKPSVPVVVARHCT